MPAHVTLDQWKVFRSIIEEGGYAQAARKLNKSQSAISYAIANLQDQLGVRLLEVKGRKAVITEPGKLFLRRAISLIEEADSLEKAAETINRGWETEIAIAVEILFPLPCLLKILDRFQAIAPHTRIEIIESVLSGTEDLILAKKVDLAISGANRQNFQGFPLQVIEFFPVCSPRHPLANLGRPVSVQDLKAQRQIIVRDSGPERKYSPGWQQAEQRWTFTNMSSAVAAIKGGFGFAWAPYSVIENDLSTGQIVVLETDFPSNKSVQLHLVYPDQNSQGPATRALAEIILETVQGERLSAE